MLACSEAAYGVRYGEAARDRLLERFDGGDVRCAVTGDGELVGLAAIDDVELTVPGPALLRVAGWSEVAVAPTARRRGVLRALVGALRAEAVADGRAGAVLFASEAGIYGRFGFAPACSAARYQLDLARVRLRPGPAPAGRVHLLRPHEAASALPAVFDAARRLRPGEVDRAAGAFATLLEPTGPAGAARFVAAYERSGRLDGYAVYDVGPRPGGRPGRQVELVELVAVAASAEAALWDHLLATDLVRLLVTGERPVDEALRHRLEDPRALETVAVEDHLWLCLLDPAGALAARRYGAPGRLILEVRTESDPPSRLLLASDGAGSATVAPTTAPADLVLDGAALAAAYLGGTSLGSLCRAGRVQEHRPGARSLATALLATEDAPFCTGDV